MARRNRYNRKRRRGGFSLLYKLLTFLVICAAIAVALTLFFKVERIDVIGAERYTQQKIIDASGIQPVKIGRLPTVCAAINMTNINTQLMTIEAGITHKREAVYQAAMLDPHTTSELSIDDIVSMVDDLIEAHGDWLPKFN